MSKIEIPPHILEQVHILAATGRPIEQIAFMLRMSVRCVEEELQRVTTTKKRSGKR